MHTNRTHSRVRSLPAIDEALRRANVAPITKHAAR